MKKEVVIFIILFLFLALGTHFQNFVSTPIEHIQNLPYSDAYGFGPLHPLIFTFILYILILIPRFIIKLLIKTK